MAKLKLLKKFKDDEYDVHYDHDRLEVEKDGHNCVDCQKRRKKKAKKKKEDERKKSKSPSKNKN